MRKLLCILTLLAPITVCSLNITACWGRSDYDKADIAGGIGKTKFRDEVTAGSSVADYLETIKTDNYKMIKNQLSESIKYKFDGTKFTINNIIIAENDSERDLKDADLISERNEPIQTKIDFFYDKRTSLRAQWAIRVNVSPENEIIAKAINNIKYNDEINAGSFNRNTYFQHLSKNNYAFFTSKLTDKTTAFEPEKFVLKNYRFLYFEEYWKDLDDNDLAVVVKNKENLFGTIEFTYASDKIYRTSLKIKIHPNTNDIKIAQALFETNYTDTVRAGSSAAEYQQSIIANGYEKLLKQIDNQPIKSIFDAKKLKIIEFSVSINLKTHPLTDEDLKNQTPEDEPIKISLFFNYGTTSEWIMFINTAIVP